MNEKLEKLSEEEKKIFKEILESSKKYAKSAGLKLNPDKNIVTAIVIGLVKNKLKYGEPYCPCRVVTGDPEEDKKIICPCVYHKEEIKRWGHCLCRLFVKG
jgi:ferredoxin-thioredoxin reductase catalytic subunit